MSQQLVDGGGEFGGEVEDAVGHEGDRVSPWGDVVVDEFVGEAFGGKFSSR